MSLTYRGGAPTSLDALRLSSILGFNPADRRLLAGHLARHETAQWQGGQQDEQAFYENVQDLIARPGGVSAWERAARVAGGKQRHDKFSLTARLGQALSYKISELLGTDAFLPMASELHQQRQALRDKLRGIAAWVPLAEMVWLDVIERRDAEGAFETIATTPQIDELLPDVLSLATEHQTAAADAELDEPGTAVAGDDGAGDPSSADVAAPPVEPAAPDAVLADWSNQVERLARQVAALDVGNPDSATARNLHDLASRLIDIAEQAEAALVHARRGAMTGLLDVCREAFGEEIGDDMLHTARESADLATWTPSSWDAWIITLNGSLAAAVTRTDACAQAQTDFKEASVRQIDDISALETSLEQMKTARHERASAIEELVAALQSPNGTALGQPVLDTAVM